MFKSSFSSLTLACCLHMFYYGLLSMCRMSKTDHIENIILLCFVGKLTTKVDRSCLMIS